VAGASPPAEVVDIAATGFCPWETTLLLGRSAVKQVVAGAEWLLGQDRAVTSADLARLGVQVGASTQAGGGSTANAMCAAARAGAVTAFAGVVGDDPSGEAIRGDFARHGVRTDGLVALPERRTRELILVTWAGRPTPRQIPWVRQPAADATEEVPRPACRVLHLGSPSARQLRWAREQREAGGRVSVDLGPAWERGGGARGRVVDLLRLANVVFLSGRVAYHLAELFQVDRHLGHDRLALDLRTKLPECEILVLTLGQDGAVAVEGDRALFAWPIDVEEVDPTGAGDCLAGHLLAAYVRDGGLRGEALESALREATAAAGLAVTALGARGRLASRAEASERASEVELATVRRRIREEPTEGAYG
jgi:sugar/nucleoside kinase (ribokinase family)